MSISDPRRHETGRLEDEIRWAPHFGGAMACDLDLGTVDYIACYRSPALTGTGLAFATWRTVD